MRKKGFSLIELIIVMTIIMILTVVGIVAFTAANKRARDSRRQSDLNKIQMGLEMSRQIGSTYPTTAGVVGTLTGGANPYMQSYPSDPKSGGLYVYVQGTPYTYNLCAYMEDSTVAAQSPGTCGGGNCGLGTCNYQVRNP